jgi:hypothetical protein
MGTCVAMAGGGVCAMPDGGRVAEGPGAFRWAVSNCAGSGSESWERGRCWLLRRLGRGGSGYGLVSAQVDTVKAVRAGGE